MVRYQLARADEEVDPDAWNADDDNGLKTVTDWKKRREMREVQRIERSMLKDDEQLLVAAELEVAVGQLLAGIQTALTQMPGTESRFLVGIRDVHVVQTRLQDAMGYHPVAA
jgi:hypothetical protein